MGTKIPEEEIGVCEFCGEKFPRAHLGQKFCCNAHGSHQKQHSEGCRVNDLSKSVADRSYNLETTPAGDILWHMQSNWADGNPIFITTGAAALNYKGAQLNYGAAEKIAKFTKALFVATCVLAFITIVNVVIALIK